MPSIVYSIIYIFFPSKPFATLMHLDLAGWISFPERSTSQGENQAKPDRTGGRAGVH